MSAYQKVIRGRNSMKKLPEMMKKMKQLEKKLAKYEG